MGLGGIVKEENIDRKEGQRERPRECPSLGFRRSTKHEPRKVKTIRNVGQPYDNLYDNHKGYQGKKEFQEKGGVGQDQSLPKLDGRAALKSLETCIKNMECVF